MAFFNIRQWIDRVSQFPNRRTLTNVEDPTDVKTYDLSRAEGEITTQGTAITGANLTDLENRIASAFTAVEQAMPEANPAETATVSLIKIKINGTVYEIEGGGTTIEKITKAQWDAMTAEERAAFIGVVEDTNADCVPLTADNIPYDSENSIAEKITGIEEDVDAKSVKSIFLTTTYACSYSDNNTIGYRGTGPNITSLTGYPTGKNVLAVVIERSYVDNKIYPAITSLDSNILYTESKNSGTAYIGMRVLYTD